MTTKKYRSLAAAVVLGSVGAATADVGPVPGATLITGTTLCVVDGWEYAPRWSVEGNGYVSPSLEECAADCEVDAICKGATFIVSGSEKNCWFKEWPVGPAANPCMPPADSTLVYQAIVDPADAGGDCAAIMYMEDTVYSCPDEPEEQTALAPDTAAMAPAAVETTATDPATLAALMPAYAAYPGVDYSPNQVPPPLIGIEDVPDSAFVATDAVDCASACTDEPACNAASYYGDNPMPWPGDLNCYLKTLTGCTLPDDVVTTNDATIFMIGSGECADAPVSVLAEAPISPLDANATALPAAANATALPDAGAVAPVGAEAGAAGLPGLPTDAAPPLGTEAAAAPEAVGTDDATVDTRAFAADAPAAASDETGGTSVPAVSPADTSSAMGALVCEGCAAAASALAAAVLLL